MEDKSYLGDVSPDKVFFFRNGNKARNVYELAQNINSLDEDSFRFHCNLDHDDFANWIGGEVGDIELSQKLRYIKEKEKYLKHLNKHIEYHEKKTHKSQISRAFTKAFSEFIHDYGYVLLLLFVIISTIIFTAMIYFQYHSLQNIKALDEKINYMESRNTCYNNFFGEQALKTRELLQNVTLDNYCVYNLTLSKSPPERVLENRPAFFIDDDITLKNGILTIDVGESYMSYFSDSSSMLPGINHNTRGIGVKPRENELNIGDIISYDSDEGRVIHRIVDTGSDAEGKYYITKGDNNDVVDEKVRFEQIKGKVVVLIY